MTAMALQLTSGKETERQISSDDLGMKKPFRKDGPTTVV
jgi:hypothetical protein